ncbi:ribosyldihydronicotinamide dehydrogenase [quinone] [Dromaius novaehollandiae]
MAGHRRRPPAPRSQAARQPLLPAGLRARRPPAPERRAAPRSLLQPRGRLRHRPARPPRPYWILRTETTTCSQKMAGRKVLIIYAHQEPKSLNGSLKDAAVEELGKQGCSVTVSDLYAMQFEPRATRNDIVGCLHNSEEFNYGVEAREAYKRGDLSDDLIEEQKKVQEADLLIFQFPLYWFSMPAIMKGWMDRVLVEGFAHEFPDCYGSGLLK